jgi:hypothetical protein
MKKSKNGANFLDENRTIAENLGLPHQPRFGHAQNRHKSWMQNATAHPHARCVLCGKTRFPGGARDCTCTATDPKISLLRFNRASTVPKIYSENARRIFL